MAFPFAATNLGLRSALEAIARRKNATLAQLSHRVANGPGRLTLGQPARSSGAASASLISTCCRRPRPGWDRQRARRRAGPQADLTTISGDWLPRAEFAEK